MDGCVGGCDCVGWHGMVVDVVGVVLCLCACGLCVCAGWVTRVCVGGRVDGVEE